MSLDVLNRKHGLIEMDLQGTCEVALPVPAITIYF